MLQCVWVSAAFSSATPWVETDYSRVRLISAQETLGEQGSLMMGLEFKLEEGWKTYWRTPGDAGYPVSLGLEGSDNLSESEFFWPVPHRFTLFGLETFGYSESVIFPFEVKAADPERDLLLKGQVSYLLCKEICIPFDAEISIGIPAGDAFPSLETSLIDAAVGLVPGKGAEAGLAVDQVFLQGSKNSLELRAVVSSTKEGFVAPDLVVEGPPEFSFSKPEVVVGDDGTTAVLTLAVAVDPQSETVVEGKQLRLLLMDGARGLEVENIARFDPAAVADTSFYEFSVILAVALLGGFILNLMPCVLPVLSLKMLSVVKHGGREGSALRRSFLMTSAGIVSSFLLLASLAIGVKALGVSVGWGIQFQQPLFLIIMAVVVTLFAANLFGWFEVLAPSALNDRAVAASGSPSLRGDFFTGVFATLLATPCSAPFLGTAVGFALARGSFEILVIFTFLGLGMAIPYLLVALKPGFATLLPRPGAWMVRLKVFLGLLLLGTGGWLLAVLQVQIGTLAALLVAGLLLAGLCVMAFQSQRLLRRGMVMTVLGVMALVVPMGFAEVPKAEIKDDLWQNFDVKSIPQIVADGRIVFVDVTADWCLTCQVNKKLVLEREEIRDFLATEQVVPMLADWTLPSEEITAYLKSYGRYGIPFNIVYGPGAPDGIVLSELLTMEETLEAFKKASARQE